MSGPIISVRTGLYIDGAWRAASDGAELEVLDPASEEVIASVASASIEDGLAAVEAAHRALPAWAATAPRRRAEILRKAFELMTERATHADKRLKILASIKTGTLVGCPW